jgi:hypothetical protein
MPKLLPGVFSQVGRHTEFEIRGLEGLCEGISEDDENKAATTVEVEQHKEPKGALAAAIQERVRLNNEVAEAAAAAAASVNQQVETSSKTKEQLSAAFAAQGMEAWWTTRHGGSNDVGAINRRNEPKPDPYRYSPQYRMVHGRYPSWDIAEHPPHTPGAPGRRGSSPSKGQRHSSPSSPSDRGAGTFMTDIETKPLTARERAMLDAENAAPPPPPVQPMEVSSMRQDLGKIGRVHVMGQDVSHPADDANQQDIKGYHKLRYPEWDVGKCSGRKPLSKTDSMTCPGQYDVNFACVKPKLLSGVPYDRAQARDVCVRNLGYSALPRVLHPDEEGTQKSASTLRRPLPDRSYAKDSVRRRHVNVNDFSRDSERKPLLAGSKEHFDTSDPEVCAKWLERTLAFDTDKADIPVTLRRDIGPDYSRMLSRGKSAVMGVRALSGDVAVRGSVGLGFTETAGQKTQDVTSLEARKSAGSRPDVGPALSKSTCFKALSMKTNWLHGYPHVYVAGGDGDKKGAPRDLDKQKSMMRSFERDAQLPGFCTRVGAVGQCGARGGSRRGHAMSRSRTYESLPAWGKEGLPD